MPARFLPRSSGSSNDTIETVDTVDTVDDGRPASPTPSTSADLSFVRFDRPASFSSSSSSLPPPAPLSFGKEYKLPVHVKKPLEMLHPHPRDENITFHEVPHVYVIKRGNSRAEAEKDEVACEVSVTGLVQPFCEEFDEEKAIRMMKTSRYEAWPKKKYAVGCTPLSRESVEEMLQVAEGERGRDGDKNKNKNILCVFGGRTLYAGPPPPVPTTVEHFYSTFLPSKVSGKRKRTDPDFDADFCEICTYERPMSDEEILACWEENRIDASNRGTEAHYQLELWCNHLPCREGEIEVANGIRFVEDQLAPIGFRPYRTEWEIYSVQEEVAGSIDLVGTAPDPRFAAELSSLLRVCASGLPLHSRRGKDLSFLSEEVRSLKGFELRQACEEWEEYISTGVYDTSRDHTVPLAISLIEGGSEGDEAGEAEEQEEVNQERSGSELWSLVPPDLTERVNDLCEMRLVIVDWKRASSHDVHSPYGKRMEAPLHHIDDTHISRFAVQLSLYKFILEQRMHYKVIGLCLSGVHPDSPFHSWVPYLKTEAEFLMASRRERVSAKREVRRLETQLALEETCPGTSQLPKCPLSGDIAWNPVTRKEGSEEGAGCGQCTTVYDKPYALLSFSLPSSSSSLVDCTEDGRKVRVRLEAASASLPEKKERQRLEEELRRQLPWKERIPPTGYRSFLLV